MVTVPVKHPWKGKVAIRDKYYDRAKIEGLTIRVGNEQMTLTPAEVVSKIVHGSKPVPDYFKEHNTHRLLYYWWKPNQKKVVPQPQLL